MVKLCDHNALKREPIKTGRKIEGVEKSGKRRR